MTPSSTGRQDTAPDTDTASEGKPIAVLIRLTPSVHRDMRRAMAESGVRTNQEFGADAIAEKVARVFAPKAAVDGPIGRRKTAGRRRYDSAA